MCQFGAAADTSRMDGDLPISAHERALYHSLFDRETGLPTGVLLVDRLRGALLRGGRDATQVAIFVLRDLSTPRGDRVDLATVAARLSAKLRPTDTLARLDDDTLVVVVGDLRRHEDGVAVGERLVRNAGALCRWGLASGHSFDDPYDVLRRAVSDAEPAFATA